MIKINDDFYIKGDKYNWTLVQIKDGVNPRTKEPVRTEHNKFFPKLSQCLHEAFEDMMKAEIDKGDPIKELPEIYNLLENLLVAFEDLEELGDKLDD